MEFCCGKHPAKANSISFLLTFSHVKKSMSADLSMSDVEGNRRASDDPEPIQQRICTQPLCDHKQFGGYRFGMNHFSHRYLCPGSTLRKR